MQRFVSSIYLCALFVQDVARYLQRKLYINCNPKTTAVNRLNETLDRTVLYGMFYQIQQMIRLLAIGLFSIFMAGSAGGATSAAGTLPSWINHVGARSEPRAH